jgi:hypothetical protein
MKKLVAIIIAGAFAAAFAQAPVQTQAQDFEQLKIQLQQKLGDAIDKAAPDVEKARQAAIALQTKLQNKTTGEQNAIMAQERTRVQEQLRIAIEDLKKVSSQVGSEVEQAKQQIQTRLQEKMQELKDLQTRLKGTTGGNGAN